MGQQTFSNKLGDWWEKHNTHVWLLLSFYWMYLIFRDFGFLILVATVAVYLIGSFLLARVYQVRRIKKSDVFQYNVVGFRGHQMIVTGISPTEIFVHCSCGQFDRRMQDHMEVEGVVLGHMHEVRED